MNTNTTMTDATPKPAAGYDQEVILAKGDARVDVHLTRRVARDGFDTSLRVTYYNTDAEDFQANYPFPKALNYLRCIVGARILEGFTLERNRVSGTINATM